MFSLINLIKNGNVTGAIAFLLSGCFVVFVCSPVHELSHAYAAYKLGDKTAKNQGRLTFNPLRHIDPIGMIMILLFGFGYAKPVPINIRNFKNPKRDTALVSLAGPASNLAMSFIGMFLCYAVARIMPNSLIAILLVYFLYYASYINVALAAFNILPIPPLDGSKVLASILPNRAYYKYMQYERYIMIALLVLMATGVLGGIVSVIASFLMNVIEFIPKLIFGAVIG